MTQILTLQNAASANGNGVPVSTDGFDQAQQLEIAETNGGTATVTFEGSFDGSNWYPVGYYTLGSGSSSLSRTVTGASVSANSRGVYQILDPFPQLRARVSSVASSPKITVRAYIA